MDSTDEEQLFFQYFQDSILETPWNIHVHTAGRITVFFVSKMIETWTAVQDPSHRAGYLMTLLNSPRKRLPVELIDNAMTV